VVVVVVVVDPALSDDMVNTITPITPAWKRPTTSSPSATTSAGPGAGESSCDVIPAATAHWVKTGQAAFAASAIVSLTGFAACSVAGSGYLRNCALTARRMISA